VSYRTAHSKTTVGVERLDREQKELGYFHNAGYHTLSGTDFDALFPEPAAGTLAPYTEFAKFDRLQRLSQRELVSRSLSLLRRHLARAPRDNPFARFARRFAADVQELMAGPPELFHNYAFTTLRQSGSCSELAASYLRWLEQNGEANLEPIAAHFDKIAGGTKSLQLGLARAVLRRRPLSDTGALEALASEWAAAMQALQMRYLG
jgi:hypothetical protein